jgi:Ti-type conjugative transfer relaxase TraA
VAIFHFSAKLISRAGGSSAVASAAYRSASRLHDARLDRPHDFTNKAGVIHSEILLPEGAPERWRDREALWNAVEATEKRKDAQLAREVEFALPRELTQEEGVELARAFVQGEFVARGMVADLNVHWDLGDDGLPKPHAHVMLALREATADGFGPKVRAWNETSLLKHWREAWAEHVNERLASLGLEARVDHRSLAAQGIALKPQGKIGPAAASREQRGEAAERAEAHREIARRNGERIIARPEIALQALSHQQSTFTRHDLARFLHRHTDGKAQFDVALARVEASPELVALGRDGRGQARFATREMIATERALERHAAALAAEDRHGVSEADRALALARSEAAGLVPSREQREAMRHVTGSTGLALVVGYAGSGKSAMLGAAREAWATAGVRVQGAALSGAAAENLQAGAAIASRTLASLEHAWGQGRDLLARGDVLVIDEAGLVGSRQLERVLSHAAAAGAKVVMVGDAEQLQAIEAGAAFRALAARHGAAELSQIRRQAEAWQRTATRHLATGRTELALDAYRENGSVFAHAEAGAAMDLMVHAWDRIRQRRPDQTQVLLAYTRAQVTALNDKARSALRQAGELGPDCRVETTHGERAFAVGDRVMFLRNERSLGVRNGSLGSVLAASAQRLDVRLDDGRTVAFDLKDYADVDHGYATTIHKSQGATVDVAHVLASPFMDRHAAYVALSRHRRAVSLHYAHDEFRSWGEVVRALSRERAKDTTLDYPAPEPGQSRTVGPQPPRRPPPDLERERLRPGERER